MVSTRLGKIAHSVSYSTFYSYTCSGHSRFKLCYDYATTKIIYKHDILMSPKSYNECGSRRFTCKLRIYKICMMSSPAMITPPGGNEDRGPSAVAISWDQALIAVLITAGRLFARSTIKAVEADDL